MKLKQIQLITTKNTLSLSKKILSQVILYGRWFLRLPVIFQIVLNIIILVAKHIML